MRRLLLPLCFAAAALAPSLAFADVAPSRGGCSRCSVDDEGGAELGLASVALVAMIASAAALRRRR